MILFGESSQSQMKGTLLVFQEIVTSLFSKFENATSVIILDSMLLLRSTQGSCAHLHVIDRTSPTRGRIMPLNYLH